LSEGDFEPNFNVNLNDPRMITSIYTPQNKSDEAGRIPNCGVNFSKKKCKWRCGACLKALLNTAR